MDLTLKILICIISIFQSTENHIFRGIDQYERSEILEHEDHREILKDSKTIFLPELVIYFRSQYEQPRIKRNLNCQVFGPKENYCLKENRLILDDDDYRVLEDNNIDLPLFNESFLTVPDINNTNNTEGLKTTDDTSILVVKVNITRSNTSIKEYNNPTERDEKYLNMGSNEEQRIFWHDSKSKEEIRALQSKIMQKYMNAAVDPCNDFYSYACGNWKNYFTIPLDRSTYDTFEIIRENLDLVLNELLKNDTNLSRQVLKLKKPLVKNLFVTKNIPNNTMDATLKAKYFYQSCMNERVILRRGEKPLLKIIDKLGGWPILNKEWSGNTYNLFKLLGRLRLLNNDVLISQWIGPDMKNANQYIVHLDQTTLGLPTREYFLDPKNIKYVQAYKILIMGTAQLLGATLTEIEKDVEDLIYFETLLAQIMASLEERRNISDVYLKTDLSSMTLYFPQYDWKTYFNIVLGKKVSLRTPVAVYSVKYFLELVSLLSNTDNRTLQNYLIWRFVRHRLNNLDIRFLEIKQRFNFILYGREKQPPRWQFCVTQVNTHMGMAIGALFVRKYFDETSKKDTIQMTQALMESFKNILKENSWLDLHTKEYARMKIDNMDLKIGFPEFVLNNTELSMRYYDVEIHPDYFFENVLSILRHLSRIEQKRLGSEVNRTLWSTSPAVVNAYYSRNKNQIMFPAGILQPPFYHKYFPKALNFGGIGIVIGHEITHGFDDKGRLFDQQGNLMMWWRESSIKNFYEKAQCMIDQYSQYILPQIKVPLDGYLTQGENIADNGGIKESFRAYQTWLLNNPDADETLPGLNLTRKQLFFLNFAQVWCGQQRIEEAKNRMKTSVHSPGIFRIIGVLSNSEDFAKEFNCPKNSPMNPERKCTIW